MAKAEIIVYTDGGCSRNPGPGGWGVVLLVDGEEHRYSGGEALTTNNRMELMAAISALKQVQGYPLWAEVHIHMYCDSQYVKNGITDWINVWKRNGCRTADKKPVKNQELWEELDKLSARLDIEWAWVRGHAGNHYNEICDELAKQAYLCYTDSI
jgi:ribonuclease HI